MRFNSILASVLCFSWACCLFHFSLDLWHPSLANYLNSIAESTIHRGSGVDCMTAQCAKFPSLFKFACLPLPPLLRGLCTGRRRQDRRKRKRNDLKRCDLRSEPYQIVQGRPIRTERGRREKRQYVTASIWYPSIDWIPNRIIIRFIHSSKEEEEKSEADPRIVWLALYSTTPYTLKSAPAQLIRRERIQWLLENGHFMKAPCQQ